MRKLLVFLVALAVLFAVGDYVARGFAQEQAENELKTQLELSTAPDVSFDGWPFLVSAIKGEFEEIELDAARMEVKDLEFADVHLALDDVRFSVSDVLFGEDKAITASGGAGSVALDQHALSAALERAGAPFSLRLREAGAVVELPSGDEVAASVDVSKRALSIAPEGGLAPVNVALPPILENVTYELAVTHDDYVTIQLRLGPTTLRALQSGN